MRVRFLLSVALILILSGCGYARKYDIGEMNCGNFVRLVSQDDNSQEHVGELQEKTLQDVSKITDAILNLPSDEGKLANVKMATHLAEIGEIEHALEYLYRASPKGSIYRWGDFSGIKGAFFNILVKLIELDRDEEALMLLIENGYDLQNCNDSRMLAVAYNENRDPASAHQIMQDLSDYRCISDGSKNYVFLQVWIHDPSTQAFVVAFEDHKYELACKIHNQSRLDLTRDEEIKWLLRKLATSGKSKVAIDLANRVSDPDFRVQALEFAGSRKGMNTGTE